MTIYHVECINSKVQEINEPINLDKLSRIRFVILINTTLYTEKLFRGRTSKSQIPTLYPEQWTLTSDLVSSQSLDPGPRLDPIPSIPICA